MAAAAVLHHFFHDKKSTPETLGILSFESARIMARLLSLHKSHSDDEVRRLRIDVMRSEGVAFLNSKDEGFLLSLACAERLEDLNQAAIAVARLGQKCTDLGLNRFDLVYTDLKLGVIDPRKLDFCSKKVQKIVEKMEKFISSTAKLYSALESISEMEHSERKISRWKKNGDPKLNGKTNLELFHQKIGYLRKQVEHYKEISLWNQTFDKSVGLMARIVCVVYARICTVFGPYISGLPLLNMKQSREPAERKQHQPATNHQKRTSKSGPMPETSHKNLTWLPWRKSNVGNYLHCEINRFDSDDNVHGSDIGSNNRVFRLARATTVGGSALTVRYANVVILAERCLYAPDTISKEVREGLYEMLPVNLKRTVKAKLKGHCIKKDWSDDDEWLAKGWRDALEEIMKWLGPMAHDTVRWQTERNLERQKYFDAKPSVLLLQTLHYSDLEKTEAAIVEVLVGLSCIYRHEHRCSFAHKQRTSLCSRPA
ncbi:hypothetical protein UlMin_000029 [Ulmus minor]